VGSTHGQPSSTEGQNKGYYCSTNKTKEQVLPKARKKNRDFRQFEHKNRFIDYENISDK